MSRTLARRLSRLEERFGTDAKPMTIKVRFVDPDGEVTPGFDVMVGGGKARTGQPDKERNLSSPSRANRLPMEPLPDEGR
jgi:hypothetical protein